MALFLFWPVPTENETKVPIELSYNESLPAKSAKSGNIRKQNLIKLLPKKLHPGLFKMGPIRESDADRLGLNGKNGSGGSDEEELPPFTTGIQTLSQAIELDPFYRALWAKLAAAAEYPDDFSKHYISGSVSVRMEVDHRGVMTQRKLAVESENPYLETLVLFTIIKTLKDPLPVKYWTTESKVPVTVTINFIQRLPDDTRENSQGSILGHHVEINKYDYIKPQWQKRAEDFAETYVPPIIPIPGGFYIDFIHAYKMIKRIQEPDADNLRKYRVEALEDSMERAIQRGRDRDAG